MWYNIIRDIERLKSEAKNLKRKTESARSSILYNEFDFNELELIRRVIKAVKSDLKNSNDIYFAKSILKKTRWLDGDDLY